MSKIFGTEELEFGPTLSSGLAPWQHEVKPKSGDTIRFVPLHAVDESLGVWVHRKQVKYDGGFKYVVSGKKLKPPVLSPFDTDPRPDVNQIKPLRYMIVYVVGGSETLKGHVAFVELRQNLKKRDGTFDKMVAYEDESEAHSVKGLKCSLSRQGSGLTDTVYTFTITDAYKFTAEDQEVIEREMPEIVDHLKNLYVREWTTEEFDRIYKEGFVANQVPAPKPAVELHTPTDEDEIPF